MLPFLLRCMFLARIVTAAGADYEFAVSLGVGFYADGPVAASALRGRRLISDGVLVTDVVGHGAANLVHFVEGAGKEGNSSGSLGNGFEGAASTAGFLLSEQADSVHRGAILFLQAANRFFEGFPASIVPSVGHDKKYFLLQSGVLLHVIGRGHNRVVKRGATSGFDLLQRLPQFIDVT